MYYLDRIRITLCYVPELIGRTGTITRRFQCTPPEIQRFEVQLDDSRPPIILWADQIEPLPVGLTRDDDISRATLDSMLDDLSGNARQDSMGRDTVVYWPDIPYIETDEV